MTRITGLDAGRRAVDFQKTITENAPVEQVFEFSESLKNFRLVMSHVQKVTSGEDGQSHWVVEGPDGIPVDWDAVITKRVPNRVLAWKTGPNSSVAHVGFVKFQPVPQGGTRPHITMSYNRVAGVVGHVVAALFRLDPKSAMDTDLVRLKSLLEEGKATADRREVTLDEVPV
jgi:uncharacterized membrane protein